jgi:hypothetical protein
MEQVEGQIIEERDIIEVTPEQPKESCKKCKNKGLKRHHVVMIVTSFYILFAAIYGTIKLIKDITHYFGY